MYLLYCKNGERTWHGQDKLCPTRIRFLVFVARIALSLMFILSLFRSRFPRERERLVLCFCWRQKPNRNFRFRRRRHLDFPRRWRWWSGEKKRFRKIGSFYTLSRFYIVYKPPPHLSRIKKYRSFQGKSEKTLQFHDDPIVVNRRRRSNVIRARLSVQQLSRNSWRA